jgi:ribonucleotide reductase alpha subunit
MLIYILESVRKFFDEFAHENGFDPLVAKNWYQISTFDIRKKEVRRSKTKKKRTTKKQKQKQKEKKQTKEQNQHEKQVLVASNREDCKKSFILISNLCDFDSRS